MNAVSEFYAGKPLSVGLFPSTLAAGRQVVILAKLKANKKTGRMIQLAFLDPTIKQRKIDSSQHNGQGCDNRCTAFNGCYVQSFVFHIGSIASALDDYNAGLMPAMAFDDFLDIVQASETSVRLGEFGDPASVSFNVIDRIVQASQAAGHTGYSHHWRTCDQRLKRHVMASVENESDYQLAKAMGWNCFYVGGTATKGQSLLCLNSSHGKSCADCLLCSGDSKRLDIVIDAHGRNARKLVHA